MAATDNRAALEGLHTAARIFELTRYPVEGSFDAAHLREINRRIFQDLPALGFTGVTPGEYRPPVAGGRDWYKARKLEGHDITCMVSYSRMDLQAQAELEQTLSGIDPEAFGALDTHTFIQALATLYISLDYLHPFPDGNSRTLRVFTAQLAAEAGYDLDWTRFAGSEAGRNVLYVARDLSVNRRALPLIRSDETRRLITYSLDVFEGSRDLPDLLQDAVRRRTRRPR